ILKILLLILVDLHCNKKNLLVISDPKSKDLSKYSGSFIVTPNKKEALDFLDSVLARPELQVSMDLAPGDLQIVNNFLCLHARTSYQDSKTQKRRLIRLWLDNENSLRNGPGKMDWYMPEHSRFLRERKSFLEVE
ncbi:MAG: TauD/TfdA family dioxygenase, partial [Rhodospirillales bacterium]